MNTNSGPMVTVAGVFSSAALVDLVEILVPRRVLVIGYGGELATIALSHAKVATWIGTGCDKPPESLQSLDYRKATTVADASIALRNLDANSAFDLILVDHHHGIETLREHVSLCVNFADSQTVWVFDDAVPQDLVMAADRPASGWWVGSVWRLPSSDAFRLAGFCGCLDSRPTGLLIARGLHVPSVQRKFELHGPSLESIDSLEQLRSLLPFVSTANLLQKASKWALERFEQNFAYVRSAFAHEQLPSLSRIPICEQSKFIRSSPSILLIQNRNIEHRLNLDVAVDNFQEDIFTLTDGVLLGSNMMLSAEGVILNRYESAGKEILERVAKSNGLYHGEGSGLVWNDGRAGVPRERISGARPLKGNYLLITPDERDNWGMWLLLALPSLHWYVKQRSDYAGVICYGEKPWQRQFLEAYDLNSDEITFQRLGESLAPEKISWLGRFARNLAVSDFALCAMKSFVASDLVRRTVSPINGAKKIYISRHSYSSDGYRQLTEERELEDGLSSLGFLTVQPEQYSLPVQAKIFSDADIIVGPGGAGLFNAVFCKPGTKICTIEGSGTWVHSHVNLFASLKLDPGVILGWEDQSDSRPSHKRWHVKVDECLAAIEKWLKPNS